MVTYNLIIYGFISIIQTKWIIFSSEFLMKYQEKLYKLPYFNWEWLMIKPFHHM